MTLDTQMILTQGQLKQLALDAGWHEADAHLVSAIAMAESSGRSAAHNSNRDTGDNSYGIMQINMIDGMGPERRRQFGIDSNEQLFDPATNMRAARAIYESQGWNAWGAFSNGSYEQFMKLKTNQSDQSTDAFDSVSETEIGRLYTAAFGRVPDEGGLQYWVNVVNDPLVNYKDVSQNFVDSPEFSTIALPNASSDVFATALYKNVLGRAPDAPGLSHWTNQLNSGLQDRADVLMGFANSPENVALYETLV